MKWRKWESSQKLKIVLEGLSGQIDISKLCNKCQISQVIYYRWREQLLQYGHQAFESKNINKRKHRLQSGNKRLKEIIGDLTVELIKASLHDVKKLLNIKIRKCKCIIVIILLEFTCYALQFNLI
jgi:transposase-like protein